MNGRLVISVIDSALRLGTLAFIWGLVFFVILVLGGGFGQVLALPAFLLMSAVALLLSHIIMQRKFLVQDPPVQSVQSKAPPQASTDALSTRDLMALLDDDDLDDLRAEVRETLRSRIQRLSGGDVDSFEDLLADGGKRKRVGR